MSFLLFFVYLTISLVIYWIIGVLIYKFFIRKKRSDDKFEKLLNDVFENNDDIFYDNKTEDNKNEKIYTSF